METKIAESLERVKQALKAVRREKVEYHERVKSYWASPGLDKSEVEAAVKWAEGRYPRLLEKERELVAEKQELKNLAELAKREDLEYAWRAHTHRFR
ncbi:hypothetical protein ACH5RR_036257 [Cinchona calisaya]|uniref:Uncharacterized protein n=1 Tax=Cinchona calisaya TaxID=153742 RepID=A0ABD2Y2T9_9GENT